jgi:hypothetical protein
MQPYANSRVDSIVESGLLTSDEVRALFDEARQKMGLPPVNEWGPPLTEEESTATIPVQGFHGDQSTVEVLAQDADLVQLTWRWDDKRPGYGEAYTVVDVLGTKVHVYMTDLIRARQLGLPIVSGGIQPVRAVAGA